jgi:3D (Asp-Asp-Asp) domain-containing protein
MFGLRSWKARVALGAAVAITGSALGLYLAFRPQPQPQAHPKPQIAATPPVVAVGSTTVAPTGAAEYLSVVSTNPAAQAVSAKVNAPITLSFNLPVDPAGVKSAFSVLPPMTGAFKQGGTPQDVVFTPDGSFPTGGSVNVVVRKGLTSVDGFVLQDDFSFTFATQVASNDVMFQSDNQSGSLFTSKSGAMAFTIQVGDGVPSDIMLQTFRATAADLVKAFVYGADGNYISSLIDTSGMKLVDTNSKVNPDAAFNVAQPDGIYLLLVSDADGQYGSAWVDFSKYGVLLRQDDQKIVVAGQDLTTGDTSTKFDIAFYRLLNKVVKVVSGSFAGTGEFPAAYPANLDLGIATGGGEEVIVPMNAPGANGDIKIMGSLSRQIDIYMTTDRAAYRKGETVRFAGVVRVDNDQAYTVPAATKVTVYATTDSGSTIITQVVSVSTNGTFAGKFMLPAGAFNKNGTDAHLALLAQAGSPSLNGANTPFAVGFDALGTHSPATKLTVTFDKPSYVALDTIVASITGTDNLGKPLAGKVVKVNLYATQNPSAPREMPNYPAPGSWGLVVKANGELRLDATGHVSYSFAANAAKKVADQQVTLLVRYGSGGTAAIAARSTIVYQAADEVFLLPSRSVYREGEVLQAPFVVETVAGERVANGAMSYELDNTDYTNNTETTKVAASGTLTTDENGVGIISINSLVAAGNTVLKVKGKDVAGNVFQAVKSLSVYDKTTPLNGYDGTDQLVQLSVATDKIAYKVGDTAHLVVTSPAALKVLMAVERGRIHQYKWLTLAQGDTQLTLDVSPDMAPGFTLVFAYFLGGSYLTEALPVVVNDPARVLTMTVTPDQPTYTAGQTAHLDISIKDSAGTPVAATVVVDGYDAAMSAYKLVDQAPIAGAFFVPAKRGTNASSSLAGIGGYGGRCGGGPGPVDQPAITNAGQLVVWLPAVATDATGYATIDVPMSGKAVRLVLIASTPSTSLGQLEIDVPATT